MRDILITVDRIPGTTNKVASLLDITERKKARELVEENLRFLQSLIDAIPNPIFYKGIDGRHLGCNKAFAEAMGKNREEIIGKTSYELHPVELADSYLRDGYGAVSEDRAYRSGSPPCNMPTVRGGT